MDAVTQHKISVIVPAISLLIFSNNESDDSSDDSSSDSENEVDISLNDKQTLFSILMASKLRGEKPTIEKITDYVDRVIPNYNKATFKEHFR